MAANTIEDRIKRLHANGIVDLHFDLLMDLYEKRERKNVLAEDFLSELETGGIGVVAAAMYIEERYLPEMGLRVGLDQIARLYVEVQSCDRFAICKNYAEIVRARASDKIALLIAMEGVEPFGTDIDLVRMFYELGVRVIGLTLVDLAHINPAGFKEIFELTTKPLIVSHTNARKYYDVERNISDEQIKMIGERRGVIGINSVLVSAKQKESTLDCYIDHIEHVASLIGIDCVGIGFDFFEFIYAQWPESKKKWLAGKLTTPHFIPDLTNHSHGRNLTRKLVERGFGDDDIEKILRGNWMRIFKELL